LSRNADIEALWRTGNLTGDARHQLVIRVRAGYMQHGYQSSHRFDNGSTIYPPFIWKGRNHNCWKGVWIPNGNWITVPNIISKQKQQTFEDQGTTTITVVMANIYMEDAEGVHGLYHLIKRGWYSPMRGVRATTRPKLWDDDTAEWTDVLNGGFSMEVWEGYGPDGDLRCIPLVEPTLQEVNGRQEMSCRPANSLIERTFVGLIDTCEIAAQPDQITSTVRDFNVLFTDQRLIGRNKAPECRAPLSFADRRKTQGEIPEFGTPSASSGTVRPDHVKGINWESAPQDTATSLQWVEITSRHGYFEQFFLAPGAEGQEVWLSMYLPSQGSLNRTHPIPPGWVDLGYGNVPGTTIPFLKHWRYVPQHPSRRFDLGESFNVPDGTKFRLWFSNLQHDSDVPRDKYVAKVNAFYVFRFGYDPEKPPGALVNAKGWILTEDASDVVRMLAIWAGFREWHIEDFGWSLAAQMHYGQTQFFQDVLNEMLAQGNFVMFMASPSAVDESLGIPHFVHQGATSAPPGNMLQITDEQTLEIPDVTWDLSNLPYAMRYRGETAARAQGGRAGWGLDLVRRYQATYYPPWTGEDYIKHGEHVTHKSVPENRIAGVQRYFSQTLGQSVAIGLRSDADCYFACILAAIQYCLAMATVKIQIPGVPGIELNDQISLIDEATGLNTRVWVASIEDNHTMGPNGKWEMTISGSLIDTQDMVYINDDYYWAYLKYLEGRAPKDASGAPMPNAVPLGLEITGTQTGSG
jgi:hypothetical protein